ncbi:hypothetical protein T05_7098 [Trichinella murrelli]|uniref:Uncharacterized protein n=1 Tax=Trichinella murrelli TaxID=144512 RepID=A0A0V0UFV8_9BILA|nr:hypothetical protein T05_7098 [Trichinella murrelli]
MRVKILLAYTCVTGVNEAKRVYLSVREDYNANILNSDDYVLCYIKGEHAQQHLYRNQEARRNTTGCVDGHDLASDCNMELTDDKAIPFELCNVSAMFQRLMETVLYVGMFQEKHIAIFAKIIQTIFTTRKAESQRFDGAYVAHKYKLRTSSDEAESSSTDEEDVSDYLDQEEDLITSSKLATYETGVKCAVLVSCRSWRNLLCWLSVARCNAHLKRTFGAVDHLVRKYAFCHVLGLNPEQSSLNTNGIQLSRIVGDCS